MGERQKAYSNDINEIDHCDINLRVRWKQDRGCLIAFVLKLLKLKNEISNSNNFNCGEKNRKEANATILMHHR